MRVVSFGTLACYMLVAFLSLPATGENTPSSMELIGRLQDPDAEIRLAALRALQRRGPQAKTAVPALIDALEDQEPLLRIEAARALGAIGPDAKTAVPALVKRLEDKAAVRFEGSVAFAAAKALGEIGPHALPPLLRLLESEDWTRFAAVAEYHLHQFASPPRGLV